MGVEPTSSAWKADALTVVLHLQERIPRGPCPSLYAPAQEHWPFLALYRLGWGVSPWDDYTIPQLCLCVNHKTLEIRN